MFLTVLLNITKILQKDFDYVSGNVTFQWDFNPKHKLSGSGTFLPLQWFLPPNPRPKTAWRLLTIKMSLVDNPLNKISLCILLEFPEALIALHTHTHSKKYYYYIISLIYFNAYIFLDLSSKNFKLSPVSFWHGPVLPSCFLTFSQTKTFQACFVFSSSSLGFTIYPRNLHLFEGKRVFENHDLVGYKHYTHLLTSFSLCLYVSLYL